MQIYFCAYQFDGDDFSIRGIYSKREDAQAHVDRLKIEAPRMPAAVADRSHDMLVNELVEARLRTLAHAIYAALPGVAPADYVAPDPTVAIYAAQGGFPVAFAKKG